MKHVLFVCFLALFQSSCAQVPATSPMNDTLPIAPNTVRVKATVLSCDDKEAILKITTLIGSGQGIVNPVSEGQQLTVQLREKNQKIKTGAVVTADLKEKLGVDASQSYYVIVQFKE